MNKKLIFLVVSFLYMVTATAQPLLIPYPRSIEMREGYFVLTAKTGIINLSDKNNARLLKHYIEEDININLHEQRGDNNIFLITNRKLKESLGAEGYRMNISTDSIVIEGAENAGVFYGIQTLRQLAAQNRLAIPCMEIFDKPEYEWRDFMLDEARHFKGKVVVKQLLEEMAYLKMNKFHWHLTDDQGWRIEIEKYPRLTQIGAYRDSTQIGGWNSPLYDVNIHGGYYTREDIREIVDFAAERHIEIVPEIEMPGHSEEVLATYPELSCSGKPYVNADFCIGTEKTFEFLENVLLEVIDLFPSEYIHIGGDEASKSSWNTCPRCQKRMADEHLNSVEELQSYMIHRIEKFLNDHGRKIIGWDEIIEGGLSPTATVMSWRGEEGGIKAVKAGNQAIMTPGKYCYLDAFQDAPNTQPMAIGGDLTLEKVYSFEPVPDSLSTKEAKLILGVQGNVWTEHIPTPEHYEYMIYPRILALAEIGWSPSEVKKWDNFHTRALQAVNILREQGYNPFPLEKEIGDKPESYQKVNHLAIGKKVTYANPYSSHYAAQGEKTLVDGVRGGWMYNDDRWQGFIDCDFDVTIDLGKETDIKQVCAEFIQLKGPYVWLPKQVIISSSVDGEHYDTLATVDNDISPDTETLQFKEFGWEGNAKARYIRYKALSNGIDGGWLFTDEIRIK
mgnify:FL=1